MGAVILPMMMGLNSFAGLKVINLSNTLF